MKESELTIENKEAIKQAFVSFTEEKEFDDVDLDYALYACKFTRDTMSDFTAAREGYAERGKMSRATAPDEETTTALFFERVQTEKGQMRKDLIIVDCGEFRTVFDC